MKVSNKIILFASWSILIFAIIYIHFLQGVTPVALKKQFIYFPFEIGQWTDKEKAGSDYLTGALGADDILTREYENKQGEKFELYFAYFEYTKEGKTPHAPQLCWVGSGWNFKSLGDENLTLDCKGCPQVVIKKILATKNKNKILLLYCYKINGKYASDLLKFRVLNVLDSIIKRRNSAFTLQLSAPLSEGEGLEMKEKEMKDFLVKVFSILEADFLP